jgi:hypothetical protein
MSSGLNALVNIADNIYNAKKRNEVMRLRPLSFYSLLVLATASQAFGADNFSVSFIVSNSISAGGNVQLVAYANNGGTQDPGFNESATITFSAPTNTYSIAPTNFTFSGGAFSSISITNIKSAGLWNITITQTSGGTLSNVAGQVYVSPTSKDHLVVLRHNDELREYLTPGVLPGYAASYNAQTHYYYYATITAGNPVAVSIVAVDQYSNIIKGQNCNFTINDGTNMYYPATNSTTGLAVFVWDTNLDPAGIRNFTITPSLDYAGLSAVTRNLYNYLYVATNFYMWTKAPAQVVAGVPFSVTVAASIAVPPVYNPSSAIDNVSFRLDPKLPTNDPGTGLLTPSFCTLVDGVDVGNYTYTKAEMIVIVPSLTSAAEGKTYLQGFYQLIQVMPNLPTQISLTVSPSSIEAQHTSTISALVQDAYGNPVPNVPVSFAKTAGSADARISTPTAQTNSSGIAQIIFTGGIINERATVTATVNGITQSVDIFISVASPTGSQIVNYPNPFNPATGKTSVNYYLQGASDLEIRIYDAFGRVVLSKNLKPGEGTGDYLLAAQAGGANFLWDGKNADGQVVANGIYLVKVTARNSAAVQNFTRRVGVVK